MWFKNKSSKGAKITSFVPWALYAVALVLTYFKMERGNSFWDSYLHSVVLLNGGVQGLWGAVGHLVFSEETAKKIGWKSCGFQTEVGAANLAFGITGILSCFYTQWLTPVAIMLVIFYAGCAFTHIRDRIVNRNNAPCNSGAMLYNTILVSVSLLIAVLVA